MLNNERGKEIPVATLLITVAMLTGTYLLIAAMFCFVPLYTWKILCENHLILTEIVKEAWNFVMKIWNICKQWASEMGVGVRNML